MWRWFKWLLLGAVGAFYIALAIMYFRSNSAIAVQYSTVTRNVLTSTRPDVVTEGERLARLFGCYRGCHGAVMQGEVTLDGPLIGRIVAPNLTSAIQRYSLTEFEAIVRQGVKPDGTSIFGMPSASYATMTDRDFSAIVSFIRQYPLQVEDHGHGKFGLLSRFMVLTGELPPQAKLLDETPWPPGFKSDKKKLGQYLAINSCAECHGVGLEGIEGWAPPLSEMMSYDRWEFGRLMKLGAGLGDREVGVMSEISRRRFSVMTEHEIDAIYSYVTSRN